jgi:hypothetical protein
MMISSKLFNCARIANKTDEKHGYKIYVRYEIYGKNKMLEIRKYHDRNLRSVAVYRRERFQRSTRPWFFLTLSEAAWFVRNIFQLSIRANVIILVKKLCGAVMLRTMDNVAVFFGLLMLFIFIFRYCDCCGSTTASTTTN